MKQLIDVFIILAVVSLVIGIISRIMLVPFPPVINVEANAFVRFTNTCLLFAIALTLLEMLKKK